RPSCSSSARIFRSIRSISKIFPHLALRCEILATISPTIQRSLLLTMRVSLVATFLVVDALLVLTPGPDWAYVIAVGVGDRTLVPAVAGLVAGYALLTALVAAGLGVLITTTPGALTAVTLIGGSYLVWLGVVVASRRGPDAADATAARPRSALGVAA